MYIAENLRERRGLVDRRGAGRLIGELTAAIEHDQIEILFQPQFRSQDNALVGAEALARWNHPTHGQNGIEPLFHCAQAFGRAADLSRHIANRALAAAATWPQDLRLSLNVTPADLACEDFADTILAAVAEAGFASDRLTLEITEQALVDELDRSGMQLDRLACHGIRIALDDFGAGFCNFRYLKRLRLQLLKLDRSMVQGIVDDERDLAVLRGIMAMARALGLTVVAEGIETEEQRLAVAREGCDKWQGFLGGQPMTAAEFAAFAAR